MINLKVNLDSKVYPIFIVIDILARLGEIYQLYGHKSRAALIIDFNLKDSCYFKTICDNFEKLNIENTSSPMITPAETRNLSEQDTVELNFSGEILLPNSLTPKEEK